ncbi:MAG: hypothetical protein QM784_40315 [Polyangiaceae bacterium]
MKALDFLATVDGGLAAVKIAKLLANPLARKAFIEAAALGAKAVYKRVIGDATVAGARAAPRSMRIVEQVDDIVEIAGTVGGHEIRVMANMSIKDGTLYLRQAHIQGPGAGKVGVKAMFDAIREFGKSQRVAKVVVEGAKRTTGAGNQRGAVPRAWEILVK